jgi:hypothetical protein
VTFNPGDIVEITGPSHMSDWFGLRARVVEPVTWRSDSTRIELVGSRRPDGYETGPFMWATDGLTAVPVTGVNGFAVGDRVVLVAPNWSYNTDVGMTGTVTRLNEYDGGRIPSFAVKFDDLDDGGWYLHGEYVVTPSHGFGSFVKLGEYTPGAEAAPKPVLLAVGDRVRILEAEGVYGDIGRIGVITDLHPGGGYMGYDQLHPYRVQMDNGNRWDVAKVELVEAGRGPIVVGSEVVLKSLDEYRDNNKPAITNYMAFGAVYTVREIDDAKLTLRLDGVDGGWSSERFKHAPVEVTPEAAPEPELAS